jgi:Gram-negative bacterial TonB protein C-terminal
MKMRFKLLDVMVLGMAVVIWSSMSSRLGSAQDAEATSRVTLSKLSPPVYPPLAHQAMIRGDVTVEVSLHADGTVESVMPIYGRPMLVQSAVNSARQSTFECVRCGNSGGTQSFIYSFEQSPENPDPCCCSGNRPASADSSIHVSQSGNHITVTAPPVCICPDACTEKWAEEHSHFRSPKCLYLWKCGHRKISIM